MRTSLARLPSSLDEMRLLSLGPEIHDWAKKFKPNALLSLSRAMEICQASIFAIGQQQEELQERRNGVLFTDEEDKAEEVRLANLLSLQTRTLATLNDQYHKALALSDALILHSFTKSNLAERMSGMDSPQDASPRRRMASGADQVVEV